MEKKDEASKESKKYEREILAMRKRILQWNLGDLTDEECDELGRILHMCEQRFRGKVVQEMAKREREGGVDSGTQSRDADARHM